MPSSAAASWVRLGWEGNQPLAERWARQSAELAQVAPSDPALTMMMSEPNFDRRLAIIQRAKQTRAIAALPSDIDSPGRSRLTDELQEMARQYRSMTLEIINTQKQWLPAAAENWRHRLMGHLSADLFNVPPSPSRWENTNCFTSTSDIEKIVIELREWLSWTRQVYAQLSAARSFDNYPAGEQALQLVEALSRRHTALADRIEDLEAAIGAIQAQRQRKRRTKSKVRKTRQQTRSATLEASV
jgi:hypothetical protein